MLISKKNRRIIYENLFKGSWLPLCGLSRQLDCCLRTEGVLVAKKDFNAPKHEDLDVPNLEVIKAMQSLTSKGLVKTQFSWQWYYYVLTPEGVEYLREWCVLIDLVAFVQYAHVGLVGCTSPTKLCLQRTSVRLVPPAQLLFALALAKALAHVHPAATRKATGERRVAHLATTGHPLLVLVGVVLESESCSGRHRLISGMDPAGPCFLSP